MRALQMDVRGFSELDRGELAAIRGGMALMAAGLMVAGAIGVAAVVGIVIGVAIYVYTH